MTITAGEQFARALAAKDAAALMALLCDDVDFRGLTPGAFWEAADAAALVEEILLGQWFEPDDRVTGVEEIETGDVGRRERVRYRLAVSSPDGDFVVEQQAFYETRGGRISWLRVICAGYLPAADFA